jgi:Na+/H+ antiporter NhaA
MVSLGILLGVFILNRLKVTKLVLYIVPGIIMWYWFFGCLCHFRRYRIIGFPDKQIVGN